MALNMLRGWQDRQPSGQQLEMWAWRSGNRSGPEDTNLEVSCIAVTMETLGIHHTQESERSGKKALNKTLRDTCSLGTNEAAEKKP